ncbi:MAG: flagellar hook protein FlgE [Gemmatimonadetes bacterium]|nr:MAG: flagellar hook protein FlgE [Gemmatimonadota bacterium]
MIRSLFAGVSGLRNHQVRMDVIGNNISNVNTVGYKSSRVTFEEAFAQLVVGASRPPGDSQNVSGGVNPVQVGLGMNIGSIDLLFTQGNLEATGVTTDVAIQGDSFFTVSNGTQRFYTRSGNFQLDANGRLVASTNGFVVQGRLADSAGNLTDAITDIELPFGQKAPAQATTEVSLAGNLDAEAAIGDTRDTTITVFDAMGASEELTIRFTKASPTTWDYSITVSGGTTVSGDTGTLTFDALGQLTAPVPSTPFVFTPASGAANVSVTVDFGTAGSITGLSQFAAPSTAVLKEQDGFTMGDLERFSIDSTGTITGAFTNGVTLTLAQLALTDFNNPAGLIRVGDNMYTVSANSGAPIIGFAGEGSRSTITSGALEMSNVDLAQEFTNMITAQRGFQSNARVITTADEMLQEVVSLKR